MKGYLEVRDITGEVTQSSVGNYTEEQAEEVRDYLRKGVGNLLNLKLDTDNGEVFFNTAHVVSARLVVFEGGPR